MSRLEGLRLVAKPARCSNTPIHKRRANVMRALDEQIRLAERMQAGERYTPTVPRWEIDPATGERRRIEWPRRLYAWFWQVDGDRPALTGPVLMSVTQQSEFRLFSSLSSNAPPSSQVQVAYSPVRYAA